MCIRPRRAYISFSLGAWIIIGIAIVSTLVVVCWPIPQRRGLEFWVFSRTHADFYTPVIADWNRKAPTTGVPDVNLLNISSDALCRRAMSGFLSNTPLADMMEIERSQIGQFFSGPVDDIGFTDLTDRLRAEGIDTALNEPSFGPWTSRGRVYGLPHDVHPVMLAYRADLVEAAGIDINQIETWDDFARVMKPMIQDFDGDGQPDRYLLNLWYTNSDSVEMMILQAGGNFFDAQDRLVVASAINARVLATLVSWCEGPQRIAADTPEFSASGNELRLKGFVVCSLMPDWLAGVWKSDLPKLGGKIKLRPLPTWTKGGCQTSVWGGTMLGIPKNTKDFASAWNFVQRIYLSETVAKQLYQTTTIISPVKALWKSDFYDVPETYFSGQAPGRLYIQLAPQVPRRNSSPYNTLAKQRVLDATIALRQWAVANKTYTRAALEPVAQQLLQDAQAQVQRQMNRNTFLTPGEAH